MIWKMNTQLQRPKKPNSEIATPPKKLGWEMIDPLSFFVQNSKRILYSELFFSSFSRRGYQIFPQKERLYILLNSCGLEVRTDYNRFKCDVLLLEEDRFL